MAAPTTMMTVCGPIETSRVLPGGILAVQRLIQKATPIDADEAIAPEDLMWLREYPFEKQNAMLVSEDKAFREIELLSAYNCNTIVDLHAPSERDPRRLRLLAERLGINILTSTSIDSSMPTPTSDTTTVIETLAQKLQLELQFGIDDTSIQASVIYHVVDIRAVNALHWAAVAKAQQATCAAVYLDLVPFPASGYDAEVLALLASYEGLRDRLVLCHCDLLPLPLLNQLADLGVVLSFDLVGLDAVSDMLPFPVLPKETLVPRDREIAMLVQSLVARARVLVNSTVYFKTQYKRNGGGGYTHIFSSFCRRACMSPAEATKVLHATPLALLSGYVPPPAVEIPKAYIHCSICRGAFEPIVGEYFTKFDFVYCSTKCLRKHRLAGFTKDIVQ
ncbi:hypothetical protein ACHHYP_10621 [Achlya hypogyna]|uniref:Vms1-associating treble clef domain-containing protein n=1 Tax=Achlya hypogyna TaxID=1202772 RepID=A0A1V9YKV4_ACHHY|nr:hypothetical protein ACHHYP_10621 [Achlya hypogyna]